MNEHLLPGELDFSEADYQIDEELVERFKKRSTTIQNNQTEPVRHPNGYTDEEMEANRMSPRGRRYMRRYHRDAYEHEMSQESFFFHPGEPLRNSLLTIIGPGFFNRYGRWTWQDVKCRCVCGREDVLVPYASAYRCPPYSCGCKRRAKKTDKDWTGHFVTRKGRTLLILGRTDTGDWTYLCDCCGETSSLARGGLGTINAKLIRAARSACPNAKEPVKESRRGRA